MSEWNLSTYSGEHLYTLDNYLNVPADITELTLVGNSSLDVLFVKHAPVLTDNLSVR